MKQHWTQKDQRAALKLGWGVFFIQPHLQIQRYDVSGKFPSDAAARRHVLDFAFHTTPTDWRQLPPPPPTSHYPGPVHWADDAVAAEVELCRKAITYIISPSY